MRKITYPYVFRFAVLALLFASLGSAQAVLDLPGFRYASSIVVSNNTGTALTDFQVALTVDTHSLITAGHMEGNGRDIRFVAGSEFLPYYIESGINSTSTVIYVRVPLIPANGSTDLLLVYGNPLAPPGNNPGATFDFYEGFDETTNSFSQACGTGTNTLGTGTTTFSWSSIGIWTTTNEFPISSVYVAEASVTAASGNWPGIYWAKATDQKSYALLLGGGSVRISLTGGGSDYCSGHNWASSLFSVGSPVGLWSIAWIATGSQTATFPGLGTLTSTNTLYARDQPLKLCVGGISSGTGSMTFDWVRARKYAATEPTFTIGAEAPLAVTGPTLTISWMPVATDAVLQESLSLEAPIWVDSPSGSENPAVVPTTNSEKYYRLVSP